MQQTTSHEQSSFEKLAQQITRKTGSTGAFVVACSIVLIWAVTGPVFGFSDTWQLVINTGTTIVTFLMVFLIQKTQNKDSIAIQLKLNELIACNDKASNRLVDVEDLSEEELVALSKYFRKLSEMTKNENDLHSSHTIEEAEDLHREKLGRVKRPEKPKK